MSDPWGQATVVAGVVVAGGVLCFASGVCEIVGGVLVIGGSKAAAPVVEAEQRADRVAEVASKAASIFSRALTAEDVGLPMCNFTKL